MCLTMYHLVSKGVAHFREKEMFTQDAKRMDDMPVEKLGFLVFFMTNRYFTQIT